MTNPSSVISLITRVQTRLWLGGIIDMAAKGFIASAAVLVVAGVVHANFHPLRFDAVLVAALLPLLATLVYGLLKRRPTLTDTAIATDRYVDGHSLLTTAAELLLCPSPMKAGASNYVIEQAALSAGQWSTVLKGQRLIEPPRYLLPSLGFALAGIFLLQLPGSLPEAALSPDLQAANTRLAPSASPAHNTDGQSSTADNFVARNKPQTTGTLLTAMTDAPDLNSKLTQAIASKNSPEGTQNTGDVTASTDTTGAIAATRSGADTTSAAGNISGNGVQAGAQQGAHSLPDTITSHQLPEIEVHYIPAAKTPPSTQTSRVDGEGLALDGSQQSPVVAKQTSSDINLTIDADHPFGYTASLTPAQKQYLSDYFKQYRTAQ